VCFASFTNALWERHRKPKGAGIGHEVAVVEHTDKKYCAPSAWSSLCLLGESDASELKLLCDRWSFKKGWVAIPVFGIRAHTAMEISPLWAPNQSPIAIALSLERAMGHPCEGLLLVANRGHCYGLDIGERLAINTASGVPSNGLDSGDRNQAGALRLFTRIRGTSNRVGFIERRARPWRCRLVSWRPSIGPTGSPFRRHLPLPPSLQCAAAGPWVSPAAHKGDG
jgi:hypothetical protein